MIFWVNFDEFFGPSFASSSKSETHVLVFVLDPLIKGHGAAAESFFNVNGLLSATKNY